MGKNYEQVCNCAFYFTDTAVKLVYTNIHMFILDYPDNSCKQNPSNSNHIIRQRTRMWVALPCKLKSIKFSLHLLQKVLIMTALLWIQIYIKIHYFTFDMYTQQSAIYLWFWTLHISKNKFSLSVFCWSVSSPHIHTADLTESIVI
jgi:hypothetical protein